MPTAPLHSLDPGSWSGSCLIGSLPALTDVGAGNLLLSEMLSHKHRHADEHHEQGNDDRQQATQSTDKASLDPAYACLNLYDRLGYGALKHADRIIHSGALVTRRQRRRTHKPVTGDPCDPIGHPVGQHSNRCLVKLCECGPISCFVLTNHLLGQLYRRLAARERITMLAHQGIGRRLRFPAHRVETAVTRAPDAVGHSLVKPRVVFKHGDHRPQRIVVPKVQYAGYASVAILANIVVNNARQRSNSARSPICIISAALRIDRRWLRSSSATRSARSGKSSD